MVAMSAMDSPVDEVTENRKVLDELRHGVPASDGSRQ